MATRSVVLFFLFSICLSANSQTKDVVIVVIGSSTAEGAGAWPSDSSWVNRLRFSVSQNMADQADTIVHNLGKGGYTTFMGRENGFIPPPGFVGPDPDRNITKALSFSPDIILVNYPSNDVALSIATQTTMENYMMYNSLASRENRRIFFLTAQPRNSVSYNQQIQLKEQKEAMISTFQTRAFNVWDVLVAADGISLRAELNADNGTHVNNKGHRLIFEEVRNALYAASLPVRLSKFNVEPGQKNVILTWETASELNNSKFVIERSSNAADFKSIGEVKGKGNSNTKIKYTYTDKTPGPGKNYYRLKQVDLDGKATFSRVISVTMKSAWIEGTLFPVPATSTLNLKISSDYIESIKVSLYDRAGNAKGLFACKLEKGENVLPFSISSLPTGNYLMHIKRESGISKRSFIKL